MAKVAENFETGLVFGKFYPLTKGHQYLIETARSRCRRLFVGVGSRPSETIPPEIRAGWIRSMYPDTTVVVQPNTLPYYPSDSPTPDAFYTIWAAALRDVCGGHKPDVLFTSEDYGELTARYLGCRHILVDHDRTTVPISATQVRGNPFAHWDFLDPVVRQYFIKVVCVIGPESTGKTTLCENLAAHFQTVWQPEWARDYLGPRHCEYADMEIIARGHFAEYPRYKACANRILVMDTDAITTLVYSQLYYGRVPKFVREMADRMSEFVDLYLLTDIDVPWVPDDGRDLGEPWQREAIKRELLDNLNHRQLPYVQISGGWDQRFKRAVRTVEELVLHGPAC